MRLMKRIVAALCLTALVGTVLVLGLWAGLIYAGIRIIGIILN